MDWDVPEVLVCSKCRPQLFNIEFGDSSQSQNNYISVLYAQSALLETHAHSIGCAQRHSGVGFFVAARNKIDLPACLLQSVQLALPERQKALTCFQRNCCQFVGSKFDPSTLVLLHFHVTSWYMASDCFQHSGPTKYQLYFPFGFGSVSSVRHETAIVRIFSSTKTRHISYYGSLRLGKTDISSCLEDCGNIQSDVPNN